MNPTVLKIVAGLFIFSGVSAALEIVVSMINHHMHLNFGIVNIFVGIGLLKHRAGWRICARALLWMSLIFIPVAIVLILSQSGPASLNLFGQPIVNISKLSILPFALALYALQIWQYRVLIRPSIKGLFYTASPEEEQINIDRSSEGL